MEMENVTFNNIIRQLALGITSIAEVEKCLSSTVIPFLNYLFVAITVLHLPLVNEGQHVQKTFKGNKHVNAAIS